MSPTREGDLAALRRELCELRESCEIRNTIQDRKISRLRQVNARLRTGIGQILPTTTWKRKIFHVTAYLLCIAGFLYQSIELTQLYLKYDVTPDIWIYPLEDIIAPQMTFCFVAPYSKCLKKLNNGGNRTNVYDCWKDEMKSARDVFTKADTLADFVPIILISNATSNKAYLSVNWKNVSKNFQDNV